MTASPLPFTPALRKLLPLLVFIAALLLAQNWWRLELWLNPIEHPAISAEDVVLYATSWCPYCVKVRHFLRSANIPFTEYDIENSARAYQQYQQLNGRGVPLLRIGEQTVSGYDRTAIRAAIKALD